MLCCCRKRSEAYDSKISNPLTKLFRKEAFEVLEDAIVNEKHNLLPYWRDVVGNRIR